MSVNTITFLHQVFKFHTWFLLVPNTKILEFNSIAEWNSILNDLRENLVYAVTIELILDFNLYDSDNPTIVLSKPFLINNCSCPILLSDFTMARKINALNMYKIEETKNCKILVQYSNIA